MAEEKDLKLAKEAYETLCNTLDEMGVQYEIQKTFTAINGRTYVINLSIDATVTEQE